MFALRIENKAVTQTFFLQHEHHLSANKCFLKYEECDVEKEQAVSSQDNNPE